MQKKRQARERMMKTRGRRAEGGFSVVVEGRVGGVGRLIVSF